MEAQKQIDPQDILRTSNIGLWEIEFHSDAPSYFFADAQMDRLLGITRPVTSEERYRFFIQRIHPDDRALFQEYVSKLSEIRTEIVYRYLHPTSGEMIVRCGGVRDPGVTDFVRVTGTHQDISDTFRLEPTKLAERRLAEQNLTLRKEQTIQKNYYRDLLDIQSCGLLVYTLPGHRIIHMNAEALRMYGLSNPDEAQRQLGTMLSRIYYPDPGTLHQLRRLRDSDDVVDYECILNRGYEHECHIMAKTKAIQMPDGGRASVTTFLDVSDMITLREALRRAEEGSQAKSAFLFAMSHDLRTPMNAIIGYAELMERHWEDRSLSRDYLRKLKEAGSFLLDLISNVLEVSRIESGKESLREAAWDLRKIDETLDVLLEREIARKRLHVTHRRQLHHPYVICDAMKLREIAMNLLSNAVKYTPDGGSIDLLLEESPSPVPGHAQFSLTVSDTGIGISEAYLPHLFEAFSRERDSAECGIMGTGLGLRIVKSFVDLMGGTITVNSQPDHGSRFRVEVLLQLASAADAEHLQRKDLPSLAGRRVLLAEDNALNQEIAATILQDAHLCVDTADNGAAALEMLQAAPAGYYDVILMDIQMPRMNGYQAARAIRALPDPRSKTPMIAMTANAFAEDRQAALDAGMDAYTAKPIHSGQLLQTIASVLHLDRPQIS